MNYPTGVCQVIFVWRGVHHRNNHCPLDKPYLLYVGIGLQPMNEQNMRLLLVDNYERKLKKLSETPIT